jgi:excisionase family DNA binding protein
MPASSAPKLLNISQAAKRLGVSIRTLRRWEQAGKLDSLRTPGGHRRYTLEQIDRVKNTKYERHEDFQNQPEDAQPGFVSNTANSQAYKTYNSILSSEPHLVTNTVVPNTISSTSDVSALNLVPPRFRRTLIGGFVALVATLLLSNLLFRYHQYLPLPTQISNKLNEYTSEFESLDLPSDDYTSSARSLVQNILGADIGDTTFRFNVKTNFIEPATFDQYISVAQNADVSGDINLTGSLVFTSTGEALSSATPEFITSTGGISVGGDTTFYLDSNGNANLANGIFTGAVTVAGLLDANGPVILGDAGDIVTISGSQTTVNSTTTLDITSGGILTLQPSADIDDYIYFSTSDNQPGIFFAGTATTNDPGIRINSATGQLEYRDQDTATWVTLDSLEDSVSTTNLFTDGGTYLYPTSRESIRIYDSAGSNYIDISHNGTDVVLSSSGTGVIQLADTLQITGSEGIILPNSNTITGVTNYTQFSQGIAVGGGATFVIESSGDATINNLTLQGDLLFSDGQLIDLSPILHDDATPQGLKLPQNTSLTAIVGGGEGYLAYDTTSNEVLVFDGANWNNISGASTTLQQAYEAGNTIDIQAAEGALAVDLQSADFTIEVGEGSDTGDFRIWDGTDNWFFIDESGDSLAIGQAASSISLSTSGVTTTINGTASFAGRGEFSHGNNQGLGLPVTAGVPTAVSGTSEGDIVYDATGDALYIYDGGSFSQIGGAGFTSFDITDGTTTETINSGNQITFADGTNIDAIVSATDTLTINLTDSVSLADTLTADSLYIRDSDFTNTLNLVWNENVASDYILNLNLNDGSRSLSIEADSAINQDLTSDADPSFNTIGLNDNNDTHQLYLAWGDDETNDRTLTFSLGATPANRQLTIEADSLINQDVTSDSTTVTFGDLSLTTGDLTLQNSETISNSTDGSITLAASGSNSLTFDLNETNVVLNASTSDIELLNNLGIQNQGSLKLYEASGNGTAYVAFQAAADLLDTTITYTWPSTVSDGFILQTNGSGTLTWIDPTSLAGINYFDLVGEQLSPTNALWYDLLIGGTSTSSATIALQAGSGNLLVSGRIGINDTTPDYDLDVQGDASISGTLGFAPRVAAQIPACNESTRGTIYYDAENDQHYYCNATVWNSIATGGSTQWTLSGGVVFPNATTTDFAIGGTSLSDSVFSIDESAGIFLFGGDQSINPILRFESTNSDTADLTFGTNDSLTLTGGDLLIGSGTFNNASVNEDLYVTGNLEVDGLFYLSSGVGVSSILDEDDLVSNSVTALATQQSIKAYVDTQIGGSTYWLLTDEQLSPVNALFHDVLVGGTATSSATIALQANTGNLLLQTGSLGINSDANQYNLLGISAAGGAAGESLYWGNDLLCDPTQANCGWATTAGTAGNIYWELSNEQIHAKNALWHDVLVGGTATSSATIALQANTGNLLLQTGSLGINSDANQYNLLGISAAGGAAGESLYWGNDLLCDPTQANCGWATTAGTAGNIYWELSNEQIHAKNALWHDVLVGGTATSSATIALQANTGDGLFTGNLTADSLYLQDTAQDNTLQLVAGGDLDSDYTLTLSNNNGNRALSLSGDLTVEATSVINQDVTSDSTTVTFGDLSLTGAGGLTLQNAETITNSVDGSIIFTDSGAQSLTFDLDAATITLTASTADLNLANNLGLLAQADLRLYDGTGYYTGFQAPADLTGTQNYLYTLPADWGSGGQVLATGGDGSLTWEDALTGSSVYWTLTGEQLHAKNALWHDVLVGGTATSSATIALQANTGDGLFTGNLTADSLYLQDTAQDNTLQLVAGGDLDSDYTLTLSNNNGNRALSLSGDLTVEATSVINQDVTSDSTTVTFGDLSLTGAGGLTLQNAETITNSVDGSIIFTDSGAQSLTFDLDAATITLTASTADLNLANNLGLTNQSDLKLYELTVNGTDYVAFEAAADLANTSRTYTWPSAVSDGYILQTNATGTLTWVDPGTLPSSNYFQIVGEQLSPLNALWHDVLVGGTATSSATIALQANTGDGLFTGNLTADSLYLQDTAQDNTLQLVAGGDLDSDYTLTLSNNNGNRALSLSGDLTVEATSVINQDVTSDSTTVTFGDLSLTGAGGLTLQNAETITNSVDGSIIFTDSGAQSLTFDLDAATITLTASTADLNLANNLGLTNQSDLKLYELTVNGTDYVAFEAAADLANTSRTYTWPSAVSDGYILQTNATGTLTWVDPGTLPSSNYFQIVGEQLSPLNALWHDVLVGGTATSSATIALQANTGDGLFTGNLTADSLYLQDTAQDNTLQLVAGGDLDSDYTLTLSNNNGNRALSLSGDLTVEATSVINQDVTSDSTTVTFGDLSLTGAGGLTLQNAETITNSVDGSIIFTDSGAQSLTFDLDAATITLTASTADLNLANNLGLTNQSDLKLYELTVNGTDYVAFEAAADLANTSRTYTWPSAVSDGYILQTNATGTLTWVDPGTLPSSNYFQIVGEQLSPLNALWHDVLVGGTATSSATIALQANTGDGLFTGNLTADSLYLQDTAQDNTLQLVAGGDLDSDYTLTLSNNNGNRALSLSGDLTVEATSVINQDVTSDSTTVTFGDLSLTGAGGLTLQNAETITNSVDGSIIFTDSGAQSLTFDLDAATITLTASTADLNLANNLGLTNQSDLKLYELTVNGTDYVAFEAAADLANTSRTYTWPSAVSDGYILQTNATGTLTWVDPGTLPSSNYFQIVGEQLSPLNALWHDVLVGGTATSSATIALQANTGDGLFTGNLTADSLYLQDTAQDNTLQLVAGGDLDSDYTLTLSNNNGNRALSLSGDLTVEATSVINQDVTSDSTTVTFGDLSLTGAGGLTLQNAETITNSVDGSIIFTDSGAQSLTFDLDAATITLTASTADLNLANNLGLTNQSDLKLYELTVNGTDYVAFEAAADLANTSRTYTWPSAVSDGYILQTNATGTLTWVDPGTLPSSNYFQIVGEQLSPLNALWHDVLVGGTATSSATIALQANTGDGLFTGNLTADSLYLQDTAQDNTLQLVAGGDLDSDYTLTLSNNNGNRALSLSGDLTVEATSVINQDVTSDSTTVTFGDLSLTGAGGLTLQNAETITNSVDGSIIFTDSGAQSLTFDLDAATITLTASTADLNLANNLGLTNQSDLKLYELTVNGTDYVAFEAAADLANTSRTYTWPSAVSDGYILQTNATGTLTWVDPGTLPSSNYFQIVGEQLSPLNALWHDVLVGGTATSSATIALQANTGDGLFTGNLTADSLYLQDTAQDNTLQLVAGGDLDSDYTLTLSNNNGNRALSLSGDLTVEATSVINQDVTSDSTTVTFGDLSLTGAGGLTLQNAETITNSVDGSIIFTDSGAQSLTFDLDAATITLTASTADLNLANNLGLLAQADLRLYDGTGYYTGFQAPADLTGTQNYLYTLPADWGSGGQVLATGGDGSLTWEDALTGSSVYWTLTGEQLHAKNALFHDVLVGGTATSSATIALQANTGNLLLQTGSLGINSDANQYNLLGISAAGGAAGESLYWGNDLLCDPTQANCGWATTAGTAGNIYWELSNEQIHAKNALWHDVLVGGTATSSATIALQANTGNLLLQTGSLGINSDANQYNLLGISAAGGAAGESLYWGNDLLCDPTQANCGWATTAGTAGNIYWELSNEQIHAKNALWHDVLVGGTATSSATIALQANTGMVRAADLTLGVSDTDATITTADTNEALTLDPDGTGSIYFHGSTYQLSDTGDLTLGGRITFENAAYIQNETDGILYFTEPTLQFVAGTALDIDSPSINLATQATDIELADNTASALTISQGTDIYLGITTTNDNEVFTLDLPAGGGTSLTANLFTSNLAKVINLGTGTAADTINIGTGGTTADIISIGGLATTTIDVFGVTTLGDGGSTNYATFNATGDLTFVGSADTITGPSGAALNIVGGSNQNLVFQADGDTDDYLYFDTTSNEAAIFFENAALAYTNDPGIRINGSTGQLEFRDEDTATWTAFDDLSSGASYWTLTGEQLHPNNALWHDLAIGGTATGSAVFHVAAGTGDLIATSSATTTTAFNFGSGTTSGIGLGLTFDQLSSGTGLSLTSTSNAFTSGQLLNLDWSPTAATTFTGDLALINVGANATVTGNLFAIKDNGSDVFTVSQTGIESAVPHSFTAAGDVIMAYNLLFSNQTSSNIKSNAPLTITVGEAAESNNFTIETYNSGDVVIDNITNGTIAVFQGATGNVGFGDNTPEGKLDVDGAAIGQALVQLNETGDQNILVASASGTTVFTLSRTGNLYADGVFSFADSTPDGNAYNTIGTGDASHTAGGEIEDGNDLYVTGDVEIDENLYVDGTIYQGAYAVCDSSGANCPAGTVTYWDLTNEQLHAKNALWHDVLVGGTATSSATIALQANTGDGLFTGNLTADSLYLQDTAQDNTLQLVAGGDLDSDYTLTLSNNNGNRALSLSGDLTVEATSVINQDVTSDSTTVTFGDLSLTGAGGLTLQNAETITNSVDGSIIFTDSGAQSLTFDLDAATITLTASTADLNLANNLGLTNQSDLKLYELTVNGTDYVAFEAAADLANTSRTYTWPSAVSDGYILQTNATGTLTWVDPGTLPSSNYFQIVGEQLSPLNALWHDVLVGGTATSSATIALQANTGMVRAADLTLGVSDTDATITTADTNEALTLDPDGTGSIYFHGSTYQLSDTGDLTLGGRITFENAAYIQNETDGILYFTEPTLQFVAGTALDIDSPSINLATQATDIELADNTASALTISQGTDIYLGITTTNDNEVFTLDLPAGGGTSLTANLFTSNLAKVINLGTGTAADTINIGTGGTTADIISIGGLATTTIDVFGVTTLGDGGSTNYATFNATGDLTFVGSADTITGPSGAALNIVGGSNQNLVFQADGDTDDYLYFDTTSNEAAIFFENAALAYTNDPGIRINGSTGQLEFRDEDTATWTAFDDLSSGASYWTLTGEQLHPNNALWHDLAIGGTATGSAVFHVAANTGDIIADSSATTGTAFDFQVNSLSSGTGFSLTSTSNALTTGQLFNLDWSPSVATTLTNDLFLINVGANATVTGNLFAIKDNGSDVFTVSQTGIESAAPHSFTAAGDVSMAYDLNFTNQTASYIDTLAPFYIRVGESAESNDLTLQTYNSGDVVIDNITNGTIAVFQGATGNVGFGDNTPEGKLDVDGAAIGQALVQLNETGDQNILVASASGTTVFTLSRTGNLYADGVFSFADSTPDGNAYNTIGTGDASHTAGGEIEDGNDLYVTGDVEIDENLYVDGTIYQGAYAVCDSSGANCPAGTVTYWDLTNEQIHAKNALWHDVLVGGTATSSATIALQANTGMVRAADLTLGVSDTDATITTADTNEALTLDPDGTGSIYFHGSTYQLSDTGDLTLGGRITFENAAYIQNETDGILYFTEPTLQFVAGTALDIDSPSINLATQATDIELADNTASALTISQGTDIYLGITTTNDNEVFTLDLPAGGGTSLTANLFTSNLAKVINLGTGTAADTINIGTGGTTADIISIGGLATTTIDVFGVTTLGDGGSTNYATFNATGDLTFVGSADTITGPSGAALNIVGGSNQNLVFQADGDTDDYLYFDTTSNEAAIFFENAALAYTNDVGIKIDGATGELVYRDQDSNTWVPFDDLATQLWTRSAQNVLYPTQVNDVIAATSSAWIPLTLTSTSGTDAGLAFLVQDEASDTTPFVIDNTGKVGIGTDTPSGGLDVRTDQTNFVVFGNQPDGPPITTNDKVLTLQHEMTITNGQNYGLNALIHLDPSGSASGLYYGGFFNIDTVTGNSQDFTQRIVAIQGQVDHYGTGTVDEVRAIAGFALNRAGGTITDNFAGKFTAANISTGTINNNYGLYVDNYDSGGGDITNNYGLYIVDGTDAGTLDNNYGIYLEDMNNGDTLNYALYSAGGQSYLAGNLGLGVAIPQAKLDVAGSATISASLSLGPSNEVEIGTCDASSEGKMYYDGTAQKYYFCNGTSWSAVEGAAGSSEWTLTGGTVSPNSAATDVSIGITGSDTLVAPFSVDVSNNIVRIGDGASDAFDPTLIFYASDATNNGSIAFLDTDDFNITGADLDLDGDLDLDSNTATALTVGDGTNTFFTVDATADATDTIITFTDAGQDITSGSLVNITANALSTGNGLYLSSTSTSLAAGSLAGSLARFAWNPGSADTTDADLFVIDVNGNATVTGNLFAVRSNGSDIFTVSQTGIESAVPHSFTAAGDVTIAYDLVFSNQTASKIESYGPFTLEIGQSFENNDFTLTTYGTGDAVFDLQGTGELVIFNVDPVIVFDTRTVSDTDFWAGVVSDGGNDDDDYFRIGTGTTPGSNVGFELDNSGNASISASLALGPANEVEIGTCDASNEGRMYYDGTAQKYYFCNGTSWAAVEGTGGSSNWSVTGDVTWLTDTADDLVIGDNGDDLVAPFSFDVSSNTLRIGDGASDAFDPTLIFYASDATNNGSLTYTDSDAFQFTGGNVIIDQDLTVTGGNITGANSESIDIGEAADGSITFAENGGKSITFDLDATNPAISASTGTLGITSIVDLNNDLDIDSNTATALTVGDGTNTFFTVDATADATDTIFTFTDAGQNITSGSLVNITANALSTGNGLYLSSTSTSLAAGSLAGSLARFAWNPGSADTTDADLFVIDVNGNATVTGNLFAVYDNGSSVFTVSQTGITSAVPHTFSAAGDVSLAYDLVFTNQTIGGIESYGPLTITAGESFENNNLTLKTYGTGNIVFDNDGTTLATIDDFGLTVDAQATISANIATDYAAGFFNDGNATNRYGILVQAGLDDQSAAGPSTLVQFHDGNGDNVGAITFGSSVTNYNTTSDIRLKDNIVDTNRGINDLMAINVRDYTFRADDSGRLHTGFIAQELADIYPEAVTRFDDGRFWQVDYGKLTPLILAGVQDLKLELDSLSANVTLLDQNLSALTANYSLITTDIAAHTAAINDLISVDAQHATQLAVITNLTNLLENQTNLNTDDIQSLTTTIEDLATNISTNRLGVGVAAPATDSGKLIDSSSGAYLSSSGIWTNVSDAAKKENFTAINQDTILEGILSLNISEWNYIEDSDTIRHIGPTAQDFYAAFNVGENNTTINTLDPASIALVGVQALGNKTNALSKALADTNARLDELANLVNLQKTSGGDTVGGSPEVNTADTEPSLEDRISALESQIAQLTTTLIATTSADPLLASNIQGLRSDLIDSQASLSALLADSSVLGAEAELDQASTSASLSDSEEPYTTYDIQNTDPIDPSQLGSFPTGVDVQDGDDLITDILTSPATTVLNASIAGTQSSLADIQSDLEILADTIRIASTSSALSAQALELTDNNTTATLERLIVSDTTTLHDVGITGTLTTGFIEIDGIEGSISTTIVPLQLQTNQLAGNVEVFNRKIVMTPDGSINLGGTLTAQKVVAKEVVTESTTTENLILGRINVATSSSDLLPTSVSTSSSQLATQTTDDQDGASQQNTTYDIQNTSENTVAFSPSIGTSILPDRRTKLFVRNNSITAQSKVFVTATSLTTSPLSVIEVKEGLGFTVATAEPSPSPVEFNWWIIN